MKKSLFGITWAAVQNVYWLPVLFGAIIIAFYASKKRTSFARLLTSPLWFGTILQNYSVRKNSIKSVLLSMSFVFIFLALLRPQWGLKEKMIQQEGRELFIALDVSRSMLSSDVKPNRLAFAKAKIKRLLQLLPSERVGLLVFSGAAVIQCPLTRDRALFSMFLNNLDAETISSGTTAIDQAIVKVIDAFSKLPTRKNKILVVFTDGEDFSRNLAGVKERAQEVGLHIFTYGVGTEQGAPIPILNDQGMPVGYEKTENGAVILSRLDEQILRSLAHETGGKYITPMQSEQDLRNLVDDVERYEKESFEDKELSTQEDRYPYFLAISFVCLLLEWLL